MLQIEEDWRQLRIELIISVKKEIYHTVAFLYIASIRQDAF